MLASALPVIALAAALRLRAAARPGRRDPAPSAGRRPVGLHVADDGDGRAMSEAGEGVLIAIPCLNEAAHLPALLTQLLADSPLATIVVADGGSTDGSRGIVAALARGHARLNLIDNPERLQAAGINRVVRMHGAGHDWLVRIDAHCDYPDGYVAGLIAAAGRAGAQSVVVPMVSRGRRGFQVAAAAAQNSPLGTGGSPHRHVGEGGSSIMAITP
jgi:succinoglycan biosynthesis protein ExoA